MLPMKLKFGKMTVNLRNHERFCYLIKDVTRSLIGREKYIDQSGCLLQNLRDHERFCFYLIKPGLAGSNFSVRIGPEGGITSQWPSQHIVIILTVIIFNLGLAPVKKINKIQDLKS